MKKKIFSSVLLVLLVSLLVGGVAHAQTEEVNARPRGGRRGIGQITAIGSDQFTIQSRNNVLHTIFVDEVTRYRNYEGAELEYGDLQVGDWVAGIIRHDPEQGPIARLVMVLPDDYDPNQRLGVYARGHITVVNLENSTFTLHAKTGNDLTFSINNNTVFKGGITNFEDMQVGMEAGIAAVKQDDGSLLAHLVVAGYSRVRLAGEIVSVDLNRNSLILNTRRGDHISILVNEFTIFKSQNGETKGLDDLQPGMVAAVSAKRLPERGLVALVIFAGTKDQLPEFDLRVSGKIIAVGEEDFTLQVRTGEHYTLLVDEETHFHSRGNNIQGLQDLRVGMIAGVGAQDLGDAYLAKVVLVGKPPRP